MWQLSLRWVFHRSKKAPGTSSPPTTSLTSPQRTWLAQLGNTRVVDRSLMTGPPMNIPNWGSSLGESWHEEPLLGHPPKFSRCFWDQGMVKTVKTIFSDFVYASLDSLWWEDHPLISMKTSSFSCPNSRFGDEEIGFTTGAGKYAGGADMSVESNPNGIPKWWPS